MLISAVLGFSFLKIDYSTKTYILRDISTVVMKQNAQQYFDAFFSEKDLVEKIYEVNSSNGTENLIPTSAVINAIKSTKGTEAKQIQNALRQIDFYNADVHHYLEHMAQALAIDF
mgnify:CR=1 FL=1